MATNKETWLAWIARNPIQVYMQKAEIGTAAVAGILLVSRQIVYRWLDGQTIPSARIMLLMEDRGVATAKAYAAWWLQNPNPPTKSKSSIDRERIRSLIDSKSEHDPETECKIYCGAWVGKGMALVRIGRRCYTVQHAAAWAAGKIELFDRVYVYRTCKSPACANLKHIKVAGTVAEGMAAMRKRGLIVPPSTRGIYLTERRRENVKILLEEGREPKQISKDTGVSVKLIKAVARELEREASAT